MSRFNAILVGGPPHSGKSVLTYSLTQHLRRQGVEHYVLRACPDGEGDWSNEAPPATVRLIRQKGQFTPRFVQRIAGDVGRRHLPLLVDAGGRPTPEQEIIFSQCTHALLVAPDEAGLAVWRTIAERNGLDVIAELVSHLDGAAAVIPDGRCFRADLVGLNRHAQVEGPVFAALAARVTACLFEPSAVLRRRHLAAAPAELAIDLEQLAPQLGVEDAAHWLPEQLPDILAYLPPGESTCLYGRGPNWLYAAVAAHALPAISYQFDVRLGWVSPPFIAAAAAGVDLLPADRQEVVGDMANGVVVMRVIQQPSFQLLELTAPGYYLDYEDCAGLAAPPLASGQGIVLSGRVPHWLMAAMAHACAAAPWVAVYQPPLGHLGHQAVVVASRTEGLPTGARVEMPPA